MRYLIAFRTRMLTAMKRFASKRRLTGRLAQLCLFALPLAICSPLSASPTTYTYTCTGFPFSVWSDSGCPPQCNLTGSITFAQPLPSNLTFATLLLKVDPPQSYSFSDGLNTYWLASRKCRLVVFIAAMVVFGTPVDAVYTLSHSWTGLDSVNRVLNVLAWFSYCVASLVGFAGGVAQREAL